mgnify:FL=1
MKTQEIETLVNSQKVTHLEEEDSDEHSDASSDDEGHTIPTISSPGASPYKIVPPSVPQPEPTSADKVEADIGPVYPLSALQLVCPPDVNKGQKELALSNIEFQKLFGMNKIDWTKVPSWKRKNLKIQHKLFQR